MKKVEGHIKKFEMNMKTIVKQDKMTAAARAEDLEWRFRRWK